jgi:hypothetical protein
MDEQRFDRWTRHVADVVVSRRGILAKALGVASLAGPGGQGLNEASAKKKKGKKRKCKGGKKRCGKKCVNLKTDRTNCGRCGQRCNTGRPDCVNGHCIASVCPDNGLFCASGVTNCTPGCACGTAIDGRPFCSDNAGCFNPECESDDDCVEFGFPTGSVCADGSGEFCTPCTKVCLSPCGLCPGGCPGF